MVLALGDMLGKVPRLRGPLNYGYWRASMESFLSGPNLLYVLNEQNVNRNSRTKRDNARVLEFIVSVVEDQLVLEGIQLARQAWYTLEAIYGCKVCTRLSQAPMSITTRPVVYYQKSEVLGCVICRSILDGVRIYAPNWPGTLSSEDPIHRSDWGANSNTKRIQVSNVKRLQKSQSQDSSQDQFLAFAMISLIQANESTLASFGIRMSPDSLVGISADDEVSVTPGCFPYLVERFVDRWITDCISSHHRLCFKPSALFIPRRLIDVGLDGSNPRLKEFDTEKSGSSSGGVRHYATLSYCSGTEKSTAITTRSNLKQHCQQITLSLMPQTVQDAITVCRILNIPYLWVDVFCIIQDDSREQDWYKECGKIDHIYSNAYLMIAADVSTTIRSGFFSDLGEDWKSFETHRPNSGQILYAQVRTYDDGSNPSSYRDYVSAITMSPLAKRAWTLQERILPYRILHFTALGMIWECNSQCSYRDHHSSVDLLNLEILASKALKTARLNKLHPCLVNGSDFLANKLASRYENAPDEITQMASDIDFFLTNGTDSALYHVWKIFIVQYSQRQLDRKDHKLPAVSGLASLMASSLNLFAGSYLAGLWKDDLARGLLWYVAGPAQPKRPSAYIAPSWSWASIDGAVMYFMDQYQFKFEQEIRVELAGCLRTSGFYSTGSVSSGRIVLTGQLQEVELDVETVLRLNNEWEISSEYIVRAGYARHVHPAQFTWVRGPGYGGICRYEVLCDEKIVTKSNESLSSESKYYCLLIGSHYRRGSHRSRVWWLVIQWLPLEQAYRRIGIGYYHMNIEYCHPLFSFAKEETITLI